MFRKPSTPLSLQRLAARLDEMEATLDALAAELEHLKHRNAQLEALLHRLTGTPGVTGTGRTATSRPVVLPRMVRPVEPEVLEAGADLRSAGARQDDRSGWFWLLTLAVATLAGIATFYLVRGLMSTGV